MLFRSADTGNRRLVKLDEKGKELVTIPAMPLKKLAYDEKNDLLWAIHAEQDSIYQFSSDGTKLLQLNGFFTPLDLSVCANDGSIWVADTNHNELVHLSMNGKELKRIQGFNLPQTLTTGIDSLSHCTLYVADDRHDQLVLLDSEGNERERLDNHHSIFDLATLPQPKLPVILSPKTEPVQEGATVIVSNQGQETQVQENPPTPQENLPEKVAAIIAEKPKEEVIIEPLPKPTSEPLSETQPTKTTIKTKEPSFNTAKYRAISIFIAVVFVFGLFLFALFGRKKEF